MCVDSLVEYTQSPNCVDYWVYISFEDIIQNLFKHVSLWCVFLNPHLTIHHFIHRCMVKKRYLKVCGPIVGISNLVDNFGSWIIYGIKIVFLLK